MFYCPHSSGEINQACSDLRDVDRRESDERHGGRGYEFNLSKGAHYIAIVQEERLCYKQR